MCIAHIQLLVELRVCVCAMGNVNMHILPVPYPYNITAAQQQKTTTAHINLPGNIVHCIGAMQNRVYDEYY